MAAIFSSGEPRRIPGQTGHGNRIDLVGRRIGDLQVIEYIGGLRSESGRSVVKYRCRCDCGKETVVCSNALLTDHTRSCGHLRDDATRERSITHGMSKAPEYQAWLEMKKRCLAKPGTPNYQDYVAHGVKVCAEWRQDFPRFFAHVGPRPSRKHSLDRFPDPNGNYEPGNVRWATAFEQIHNRRGAVAIRELAELKATLQLMAAGSNGPGW